MPNDPIDRWRDALILLARLLLMGLFLISGWSKCKRASDLALPCK